MSQYYVRADQVIAQDLCACDVQTLPSAVRVALKTDLFEKYMPGSPVTTGGGATITRTACYTVVSRVTYDARKQPDAVPSEANTVTISVLHRAVMTNTAFRGVYWAFLMSHNLDGKKKDTNIGVSKNPIFSVMAHNNQALIHHGNNAQLPRSVFPVIYDKDTASAAPDWKLDTVIGTFFTKKEAIDSCYHWVRKTRGTDSKRTKGHDLSQHYGNSLYSSQIPINRPLESRLFHMNAPFDYIATSHVAKQHCTRIIQPKLDQLIRYAGHREKKHKSRASHSSKH